MRQQDPKKRLADLRQLLAKYSYEYHTMDNPSVTDAVYDGLMNELKKLEADYPELVTPDSPTQRVGNEALSSFKKVQHSSRMLSLNDVFDRQEVEAWIKRMEKLVPNHKPEFFVDIKMDGLGCALVYDNGLLSIGLTRGDSFIGEDVTMNIRTIKNIPLSLHKNDKYKKFLGGRSEIRGEIILYKADFEALNRERETAGLPVYANPRNLAAGTIRQLDPKLVASRPLRFRGYDLLRDEPSDIPTNMFAYEAMSGLGFDRNQQATVFSDVNKVMAFVDHWESERHKLPFNTDGLVIKLNNRAIYADLGVVGKNPRAAVAYKYPAEESTSIVKDIILSIGRTGAVTPIAVFDPLVIAGTTVKHASMHNSDEIERRDIRIGDTAVIYKAGDIIPQVSRILPELRPKKTKPFDMVAELKRQHPELKFARPENEVVYRIVGSSGSLLLKKALEHFASKTALDIDGLGEKNVVALVEAGLVDDLADIYLITKEELLKLDRFADLSASNLVKAIEASKKPTLPRLIYGLGIRHVGSQTANDLADSFGSLGALEKTELEELMGVEGIGEIVAESVIGWFADPDNQMLLNKLRKVGVEPVFESRKNRKLSGKKFVITGSLSGISRELAAEQVRNLGGTFQSSVARDTDYLVVGADPGNSKIVKAQKLGTKQLDEKDFLNLIDKS